MEFFYKIMMKKKKVRKSIENCTLSYKKDVDNTTKNEKIQFKKYWTLSKHSRMNGTNDYMIDTRKIFQKKMY